MFKEFVSTLSPLIQVDTSEENLIDVLVDWLVSLDIYTDDDVTKLRRIETQGRKITYSVDAPGERAASEEHYLAARFVSHLIKTQSEYVPFLTELGSVGLITDVVRDFQKPSESVRKTDLIVYLDAPVALDYIGLSGEAARDNIDTILSRVKSLGGSVRILRLSIEEMQTSLRALLQRPTADRTGPTAKALQRQEVVEAFVRQVSTSPDGILQKFGIGIVDQHIDAFPNEHKFFPKEAVQELYSQIRWVDGDAPRWHDAAATAIITRKRAGSRSNDLFATKHVLITRNPFFGPRARRFCLDKSFIGPNHVGPVVHQREFATGVWLRAGLGSSDQEVPRKYILSACQRVLTVTKSMVTRVREVSRHLTAPQMAQLELVLSEGRATQVLMDKTLGATNVIDSSNVEMLVAEMKRSIGEEAYAEANEAVKSTKAESRRRAGEHKRQLAEAGNLISEQRSRAQDAEARLASVFGATVSKVNGAIGRKRLLLYAGFVAVFLVSQIGAAAANLFSGKIALIVAGVAILLATIVQFVTPIRKRFIDPLLEAGDWAVLDTYSETSGLMDVRDRVSYGAPTIRKRLFVIARCDGRPIVWPEPSHGPGRAKPWRTAAEIIDWSLACPSIFDRKKPLAENTLRRIAHGVMKFVVNAAQPFIVPVTHQGEPRRVYDMGKPLPTVTGAHRGEMALVTPYVVSNNTGNAPHGPLEPLPTVTTGNRNFVLAPTLVQTGYGERPGQAPRVLDLYKPYGTCVDGAKAGLVSAFLAKHTTGGIGRDMREPAATVTANGAPEKRQGGATPLGLVTAHMAQFNTNPDGSVNPGHDAREPVSTIATRGPHQAVIATHIEKLYGSAVAGHAADEPLHTVTTGGNRGGGHLAQVVTHMVPHLETMRNAESPFTAADRPTHTVTAGGAHMHLVAAFLAKYSGSAKDGQRPDEALHTVTAKPRFGLVTVTIAGEEWVIVDIGMRMLTPRELARAQGFNDNYVLDPICDRVLPSGKHKRSRLPIASQIRMIGNSVNRDVAKALVAANCNEPLEERREARAA